MHRLIALIALLLVLGGSTVAARAQATSQPSSAAQNAGPAAGANPGAAAPAGGPTAATPAKDAWQDVVDRFAHALVDPAGDPDGVVLRALVAEHASVRIFGGQSDESTDRLRRETTGATVLGVHAYALPPVNLAADIAADFGQDSPVPEDIKRKMVPDEASMLSANRTARQWLGTVLDFSDKLPVAVIVLWRERAGSNEGISDRPQKSPSGELIFVCVKVQQSSNLPRIKQLVFGNPMNAIASASD